MPRGILVIISLVAALGAAIRLERSLASVGLPDHLPATPRVQPDILLVTIDALRADHLSSYGYERLTSTAIDGFARGAVRFDNAIAQAPYTKASVASIMTGLYPSSHKTVTASVPFPETMTGHPTTAAIVTDILPAAVTTLAEGLHDAGYRTLGYTANPFLSEAFGFAQGFDRFRFYPGPDFAGAERLVADALDAVHGVTPAVPLFVWVHLMEPHSPYVPPPWTAGRFEAKMGAPQPIADQIPIPAWLLPGTPRDRRLYVAAYDDEIAAADIAFDTLLRGFCDGRSRRPHAIVVTADHGEEFLDHGGWEHGSNLNDELIRVPLVIKGPTLTPGVIHAQVQLIDIFPTVLELAGGHVPPIAGHSLLDVARKASVSRPALSEMVGSQYALRDQGFKLIDFDDGRVQLFDLGRDPFENRDIATGNAAQVRRMRGALNRMLQQALQRGRTIHNERVPVDPVVTERLRSLGYVPQH
jgi:arylsulfatase A-like enzyme